MASHGKAHLIYLLRYFKLIVQVAVPEEMLFCVSYSFPESSTVN